MVGATDQAVTRFVEVCALSELPPGSVREVSVAGRRLALVNHGGVVSAVDGDCPHAGGPLGEGQPGVGCVLACPWHGAVFDVRDGRPLRGPARKALATYQVRIADGVVQVAVPADEQGGPDADPVE